MQFILTEVDISRLILMVSTKVCKVNTKVGIYCLPNFVLVNVYQSLYCLMSTKVCIDFSLLKFILANSKV